MEETKWFAIYTKPRWEKKLAELLEAKNIEVYCPLNRTIKQWSDRKKTVFEPLFRGYVFVNIRAGQRSLVQQTAGVVNFVYWNGKPAIVRQEEIETIQRFLNEFSDVSVEGADLEINQQIIVKNGILVDYHGIVVEVLGNKAKVMIESMGIKLSATIDRKNLQTVKKR